MKKYFVIVLILIFVLPMVAAIDMLYLNQYKWELHYKCYDDGCEWTTIRCREIIFKSDGYVYNRHGEIIIGEWSKRGDLSYFDFQLTICDDIKGTIFYKGFPTTIMEGMGHIYNNSSKVVKLFLVRRELIND